MFNHDVAIALSTPTAPMNYFYRNGTHDELIFVHQGSGRLESVFGTLEFKEHDYLVIPVSTIYQLHCAPGSKLLVFESRGRIRVPRRYRNEFGQCNEFSPFCERDIRTPSALNTTDQLGDFELRVKMEETTHQLILDHHPFDVVGWDGYLFPWALNINDFEPITGRIHQPPPIHQTFDSDNFVICSFVPRLYDYHPQAIPVPYNHANVNSDEVLYYVAGSFMSRKSSKVGTFTVHPAGVPHGPHPGTVERSLGMKETKELAVMCDTFRPLHLTSEAANFVNHNYLTSWL
jgi:homogentisate 1,2-dioxygenase